VRGTPIIIVPNSHKSILNISNVKEFLEKGHFEASTSVEKGMKVTLRSPNGVKYEVIDNATRLKGADWGRVKAIFAQGQKWQYKGWHVSDPLTLFHRYKVRLTGLIFATDARNPRDFTCITMVKMYRRQFALGMSLNCLYVLDLL
jgi:hypothetical protein